MSSLLPSLDNSSFLVETVSSGTFFVVPEIGGPDVEIYKSTDKGENWALIDTRPGVILSLYWDQANNKLYITGRQNLGTSVGYVDLTDDSITEIGGQFASTGARIVYDVWVRNSKIEVLIDSTTANNIEIWQWSGSAWAVKDTLAFTNAGLSYGSVIGSDVYFHAIQSGVLSMMKFNGTTITALDTIASTTNAGINSWFIAYDGTNLLFFIATFSGQTFLHEFNISTATITRKGQMNISFQLDRNTQPGDLEKAYHLTEDKIYQLSTKKTNQLYLISVIPQSQSNWNAVTTNFLFDDGGNVFELKDRSREVFEAEIDHGDMTVPSAFMLILDNVLMAEGMFIQITDQFITAGNSDSNAVIFEGLVGPFIQQKKQEIDLTSQAIEMDNIFPSGDFSGSSQSIINSLISTLASYITPGTLAAGQAMGTITFAGDYTLREILTDFAFLNNFIWYLSPRISRH